MKISRIAVLASGNGGNFQAISEQLQEHHNNQGTGPLVVLLVTDQHKAFCIERAKNLNVPSFIVPYLKDNSGKIDRHRAEAEMTAVLQQYNVDLVVLAGFMRLLTPLFVNEWNRKLINIHPALLPKHPGTHGIEDSYNSLDLKLGVTVHWVDQGMDTGKIIDQASFSRTPDLTLQEAEIKIHQLEHELYTKVILNLSNQS